MKFAALIPGLLLLAAAPVLAQTSPRHVPYADLVASMNAADSVQVARVVVDWRDTTGADGKPTRVPLTHRVTIARADAGWLRRLTPAMLPLGTPLSDELCPAPSAGGDVSEPWMATVLWFSTKGRGQVYLNFLLGCGFAGVGGQAPAGFWIDDRADTLLGLMREALPADTVLRDFRVALRARAAQSKPDSLPKFGAYVYVEELPDVSHREYPVYPEAARRAGVSGTVMIQALVGRDGEVKDMRVTNSIPALDSSAVACVRQWRFKPALFKGQPVAVWVAVPVKYTLH